MVTGDNLDTATAIASRCGILRDEHFEHVYDDDGGEYVRTLKPYRAMEGKTFRKMVRAPSTADDGPPPLLLMSPASRIYETPPLPFMRRRLNHS